MSGLHSEYEKIAITASINEHLARLFNTLTGTAPSLFLFDLFFLLF